MSRAPQPVLLADRIRTSIELGESHFREFKSGLSRDTTTPSPRGKKSLATDISTTLVAFANADGGELLIGVEDNGEITGLNALNADVIEYLKTVPVTGVHTDTPLHGARALDLQIDGRRILYFSVSKSTRYVHLTSDGKCLQRRDLETVPIASEAITLERREQRSREYDREFVDGAYVDALDVDLVGRLADGISRGMSSEKCLQYLDLAQYVVDHLRVRRAALLLFAKNPSRWHPRLQVRIMKVKGSALGSGANYNVVSDESVQGNIMTIVEGAWNVLRTHLTETRLTPGAKFQSQVMYPELACREALINAIAHRDYSEEGRGVEIYVFDDRMEVRSPGSLLSTVTVDELLRLEGVHQSRNSLVARALREAGYMRELGEGVPRMFQLMQSNELAAPEIKISQNSFAVVLHHKSLYSNEHILWLGEFSEFTLTREEKAIVVLGYGGRLIAPNEVFKQLGIVDTERYRQLVHSLQEKSILVSEKSKKQAQMLSRRKRVPVRDVPRFKVVVPKSGAQPTAGKEPLPSEHVGETVARLFVGNLGTTVTFDHLLDEFSRYGMVEEIKIPNVEGKPRGFAFVQMDSFPAAFAALRQVNGKMVGGRTLVVRPAVPISASGHRKRSGGDGAT